MQIYLRVDLQSLSLNSIPDKRTQIVDEWPPCGKKTNISVHILMCIFLSRHQKCYNRGGEMSKRPKENGYTTAKYKQNEPRWMWFNEAMNNYGFCMGRWCRNIDINTDCQSWPCHT